METIVLRYSDAFAPKQGCMAEHKKIFEQNGFCIWGKKGPRISASVVKRIMTEGMCKIILVRAGTKEKYWATVTDITDFCPDRTLIPEYYRRDVIFYGSFLRIIKIEEADDDVLEHCTICTTGAKLSDVINKATASYYIVDYK